MQEGAPAPVDGVDMSGGHRQDYTMTEAHILCCDRARAATPGVMSLRWQAPGETCGPQLDGSGVDIELAADDGCGVKVAESGRDLYSALD